MSTTPFTLRALTRTTAFILLLTFAVQAAHAKTRAECEQDFRPRTGQPGKDVIWWPTQDSLVVRMLRMAKVTDKDTLYDLGAGDGRIPITAAKQFGARAIGIEYEERMVTLAKCLAEAEGVAGRADIRKGDIFESDFSDATVVTLYLLEDLNLRLRPTLLEMKPGTRVVSHSFTMGDWKPDDEVSDDTGHAFLWIVPAQVGGKWTFRPQEGAADEFVVDLKQTFQQLRGASGREQIVGAKLAGPRIEFAFNEGNGRLTRVAGVVNGDQIEARVTRSGRTTTYIASRS